MAQVTGLDWEMLKAVDGQHKSRVEFEEKCRLRTLCRWGVVVSIDGQGIYRVDWGTVAKQ